MTSDSASKSDAGKMLRSLDHLMLRVTLQKGKETGIDNCTVMYGWILDYLFRHRNEDIYQKDIEKEFSVTRSAVTSMVKKMEKYGYIERTEVKHDARLKKLTLTEKGEKMHRKMTESFLMTDKLMFEGVKNEEYQVFLTVCQKVKDNLYNLLQT